MKRERRVVARTSDKRAGDLVVVMGRYIMLEECWTCGFNEKKIEVR